MHAYSIAGLINFDLIISLTESIKFKIELNQDFHYY
jgi:hypothetical protein